MTNIQAFQSYMDDENKAKLILSLYSINPEGTDSIQASMALGMIERADDVDYKQLSTSETLSEKSRASLRMRGFGILESLGITYICVKSGNEIVGGGW